MAGFRYRPGASIVQGGMHARCMLPQLITCYQRYISPYKGYRCGYAALTGSCSCSQFAQRALRRYSWSMALRLLRHRLQRCSDLVLEHRGSLKVRRRYLRLRNSRRAAKGKDGDLCGSSFACCDLGVNMPMALVQGLTRCHDATADPTPCAVDGSEVSCDIAGCCVPPS
ncbi:MAG: membrane protein insertion efficiency factor YidD [Planctomycetota bacterium]|nr:MAG: membrane protein insertion efficiency factor YidD [Planctomycetota bacterium]